MSLSLLQTTTCRPLTLVSIPCSPLLISKHLSAFFLSLEIKHSEPNIRLWEQTAECPCLPTMLQLLLGSLSLLLSFYFLVSIPPIWKQTFRDPLNTPVHTCFTSKYQSSTTNCKSNSQKKTKKTQSSGMNFFQMWKRKWKTFILHLFSHSFPSNTFLSSITFLPLASDRPPYVLHSFTSTGLGPLRGTGRAQQESTL